MVAICLSRQTNRTDRAFCHSFIWKLSLYSGQLPFGAPNVIVFPSAMWLSIGQCTPWGRLPTQTSSSLASSLLYGFILWGAVSEKLLHLPTPHWSFVYVDPSVETRGKVACCSPCPCPSPLAKEQPHLILLLFFYPSEMPVVSYKNAVKIEIWQLRRYTLEQ